MRPCCEWPLPPTSLSLYDPLRLPEMVIHHTEPGRRWQAGGLKFRHELMWVCIKCRWDWFTVRCMECCESLTYVLSPNASYLAGVVHPTPLKHTIRHMCPCLSTTLQSAAWAPSFGRVRPMIQDSFYFGLQLSDCTPALWWISGNKECSAHSDLYQTQK